MSGQPAGLSHLDVDQEYYEILSGIGFMSVCGRGIFATVIRNTIPDNGNDSLHFEKVLINSGNRRGFKESVFGQIRNSGLKPAGYSHARDFIQQQTGSSLPEGALLFPGTLLFDAIRSEYYVPAVIALPNGLSLEFFALSNPDSEDVSVALLVSGKSALN